MSTQPLGRQRGSRGVFRLGSTVVFVPVTVTGYLFLDTLHWPAANPKIGHNHGSGNATLWEVHPVLEIQ
jgi:hypothetical protein